MSFKHIHGFNSFKRINEGGGAGVDFNFERVTYNVIAKIKSDGTVTVVSSELDLGDKFDARGYEDGLSNVKVDGLLKIEDNTNISINDTNYIKFFEDLRVRGGYDYDETLGDINLIEYAKLKKIDITINIDCIAKPYKFMVSGGWMRSNFSIGDTLEKIDIENFDIDYTVDIDGDTYTYYPYKNNAIDFSNTPSIIVEEEFVNFWDEVFGKDRPYYSDYLKDLTDEEKENAMDEQEWWDWHNDTLDDRYGFNKDNIKESLQTVKEKKYSISLYWDGLSGKDRNIGKFKISEKTLNKLEDNFKGHISIDVWDECDKIEHTYNDVLMAIKSSTYGKLAFKNEGMYSAKSYQLTEDEYHYLLPVLKSRLSEINSRYYFTANSIDDLTDMLNRLKGLYDNYDELENMIDYKCSVSGNLEPFRKSMNDKK